MAEYLVKGESLTAIADKIRVLIGTEDAMGLDDMANEVNEANTEVDSQADLIAQIKSTVDNLPEAGSGGSSNIIDTCNITINSFNEIYHLSYTAYEDNIVVTKCLSGNSIDLTNIICGSAISFFNNYDFNGFTHSHDSQFIEQTARNIYTLSAPTEPNVNATIQIFDND